MGMESKGLRTVYAETGRHSGKEHPGWTSQDAVEGLHGVSYLSNKFVKKLYFSNL